MATKTRMPRVGDQAIWNYRTDYSIEPYRVAVRVLAIKAKRILVEPLTPAAIPTSIGQGAHQHWVSWRAVEPIDERSA